MKKLSVGDYVTFEGESTECVNRIMISRTDYCVLRGMDGVTSAVPSHSVEWNGDCFIVNYLKLE